MQLVTHLPTLPERFARTFGREACPFAWLAATLLACGSAFGQEDRVVDASSVCIVRAVYRDGNGATPGGYDDRATRTVYDIGLPSESGGDVRSSGTCVYDDVTFPSWAKVRGGITISAMRIGLIVPATAPNSAHLYVRVLFYPNHDASVAANTRPYSGTPVEGDFDIDWTIITDPPDWLSSRLDTPIRLDATNVFDGGPADFTCGVYEELFLDAAHTVYADTWQITRRGLWTAPRVGTTDFFGWFSGTTNLSPGVIMNGDRSGGAAATSRATFLVLEATGYPTAATCHGACAADVDNGTFSGTTDGGVTIDDLLFYLFMYTQGWDCADTDDGSMTGTPDGGVTTEDLLYFLGRFDAGC